MYFEPYGPFDLRPTLENENRSWRADFWSEVESYCEGLSGANGIYIFSLKFGSKFTPWYVGKTCSEKGFKQEVFQDHKISHYYDASGERRGRQYLHLIARVEVSKMNFSKYNDLAARQIDDLESYLIGMALVRNPKLRNISKTRFLRSLNIAGVIGPRYEERPREDSRTLKNVLGLQLD